MERYKGTKVQRYKEKGSFLDGPDVKSGCRNRTASQGATLKEKKGYTLIEVLIYGVIFSLFLLLTVQIFLTIRTMTANSFVMINLQQNYSHIFSDLNQTIRTASNIVSPAPGSSGESLSLNDGEIIYQVEGGVLQKVESGSPIELSDEGMSVSAINFENIGEATQAATIRIQMTIDSNYLLEGGRRVSEDFQTTIGLR